MTEAQYQLGICYSKGYWVAKDIAKAAVWFYKAKENTLNSAEKDLYARYNKEITLLLDFFSTMRIEYGDRILIDCTTIGYCLMLAIAEENLEVVSLLFNLPKEVMKYIKNKLEISLPVPNDVGDIFFDDYYIFGNPRFDVNRTLTVMHKNSKNCFTVLSLACVHYSNKVGSEIVKILLDKCLSIESYLRIVVENITSDNAQVAQEILQRLIHRGLDVSVAANVQDRHELSERNTPFSTLVHKIFKSITKDKNVSPELLRFLRFFVETFTIDYTAEYHLEDKKEFPKLLYSPFRLATDYFECNFLLGYMQKNAIITFEELHDVVGRREDMEYYWNDNLHEYAWDAGVRPVNRYESTCKTNFSIANMMASRIDDDILVVRPDARLDMISGLIQESTKVQDQKDKKDSEEVQNLSAELKDQQELTRRLMILHLHAPVFRKLKQATIVGFCLEKNTFLFDPLKDLIGNYLGPPPLLTAFNRGKQCARRLGREEGSEKLEALVNQDPFSQVAVCHSP